MDQFLGCKRLTYTQVNEVSLRGGNLTLINLFNINFYCFTALLTQHHSFLKNNLSSIIMIITLILVISFCTKPDKPKGDKWCCGDGN